MQPKLILASNSPRRKEIMEMLPWDFVVEAMETDEKIDENETVEENLKNIAYQKAVGISQKYPEAIIVGGDTVVLAQGEILGKPENEEDAKNMLRSISSHTHHVYTGVCILCKDRGIDIRFIGKTTVYMTPMDESEIEEYVASGEPFGKAGSYAIQGKGGVHVKRIEGDYYNVVGLPLNQLYRELKNIMG